MNEPEKNPLISLSIKALEDAYRIAKQGETDEDARIARLISRELIRRKMQPAKEESK